MKNIDINKWSLWLFLFCQIFKWCAAHKCNVSFMYIGVQVAYLWRGIQRQSFMVSVAQEVLALWNEVEEDTGWVWAMSSVMAVLLSLSLFPVAFSSGVVSGTAGLAL